MFLIFLAAIALLLIGPFYMLYSGKIALDRDWRTASHAATGGAPDPEEVQEAVVQIYAARSFHWRGAFGVHSWLAAKPKGAEKYTRYEKIGWLVSPVSVREDGYAPDALWYGETPDVIAEYRGTQAEVIIAALPKAVASYPYKTYQFWPGPNSNTFIAHVIREIPELVVDLPPTAIGKDYRGLRVLGEAPSGTGYQFSLLGIAGIMLAKEEGIELNLLSLTAGIDIKDRALKLPGIGRVDY